MSPLPPFTAARSGGLDYRERTGTGPVLVCLHGIGSNAQSFETLLPCLSPDIRVIAWDMPGYGNSTPLDQTWPVAADYASALAGLVERLALTRCYLLGHSLGALVAAAFAVRNPGQLRGLIMASCALGHGIAPGQPLSAAAQARLDDLDALGASAFATTRAPNLVASPQDNPDLVARISAAMGRVANPGYSQAVRMLASGQLLADCARLDVPTHVCVGAEDRVTPPQNNSAAFAAIPGARQGSYSVLDGAGHAVYQQVPDPFGELVSTFVGSEG